MKMARQSGMGGAEFGKLLRWHRTRAHLSASDLEVITGVDDTYITRLERADRATPSVVMVERLVAGLRLSPCERNELRVAAGFVPDFRGTPWELIQQLIDAVARSQDAAATVETVLGVLGSETLSARDLVEYRAVVGSLSERYLASVAGGASTVRQLETVR